MSQKPTIEAAPASARERLSRLRQLNRLSRFRMGQSLVELALILPLVVGILFAIIDFGYYLFVTVSVNHACREGVRMASMNNRNRAAVRDWIRRTAPGVEIPKATPADSTQLAGGLRWAPAAGEAIAITTNPADPEFAGSPPTVIVTVNFPHTFLVPLFMIGRQSANVYATSKSIVQTFETAPTITF